MKKSESRYKLWILAINGFHQLKKSTRYISVLENSVCGALSVGWLWARPGELGCGGFWSHSSAHLGTVIAVPIGQQGRPATSMVRILFGSLMLRMLSLGLVLHSPALSTGKSQHRVIWNQIRKIENRICRQIQDLLASLAVNVIRRAQAEDEIQAKFHYNPYFALRPDH